MTPSVPAIDFLPASYRARRRRNRTGRWHGTVAVAVAGLIAAGLAGNRLQHARLVATRDHVRPQAEAVEAVERQIAAGRERTAALTARADLRAALRLRPATTRLLAAVTAPLPPDAALTEFRFTSAEVAAAAPPAAGTPAPGPDPAAVAAGPLLSIHLRGVAWDDATVSDYLAGLTRAGLFESVRLEYVDRHESDGGDLRGFAVLLTLRPTRVGEEVPGGPAVPSGDAAVASVSGP